MRNFVKKCTGLSIGAVGLITLPVLSFADSMGTHCWQQMPFAHVLCFEINNLNNRYFSIVGENIMLEEKPIYYPISGSALFNQENNEFRLEFTQNLGKSFVFENSVMISDPNNQLNGTWTDDGGNSGDFQYLGPGPLSADKLQELTQSRAAKRKRPKN